VFYFDGIHEEFEVQLSLKKKARKTTTLFTGIALHSTIKCSNSNGDIEMRLKIIWD
jgi:hypothetical protein